ncbi:uncharacterized protein A4U43_UnF2240 [Asparagus officinalis]|uniref:MIT domain-containing protein n=1 Tax=Asparagus officinalis TaxID=4686 RepID=A0A1R3L7C9_ASPOF|nr:uncharacterized protein A4U43_UnF2240 [Asparagus officinalis]
MYSNFKEQAIEYVKQAVQEDNAGNYVKAFPLYMNALEYFKTHLKYEKNPKIKEAITQKFTEYLRRAEEIRAVLDEGGPGPASNGDAAVATRPKTKPKDGQGGDGEDSEQAKLRSGLNSAIIREKPDVKWNDVAGLESAKQALQEAVILPVKFPQFFTVERWSWERTAGVNLWFTQHTYGSAIFLGDKGKHIAYAIIKCMTNLPFHVEGVGNNDQKVLVLAATNTPYALDQAIRRRFDKRIYIPLPDPKARQHMFKLLPPPISRTDFDKVLARQRPTVSKADLDVHERFTKEFGEEG